MGETVGFLALIVAVLLAIALHIQIWTLSKAMRILEHRISSMEEDREIIHTELRELQKPVAPSPRERLDFRQRTPQSFMINIP